MDCRLSAVSTAGGTSKKPIQFQFPEQSVYFYSSVCVTSNEHILCSFRDFANLYAFGLPVEESGQIPLQQTQKLPAPFNSMSVVNAGRTDRVWCCLQDNTLREFQLLDGKLAKKERFTFAGVVRQIQFYPLLNSLFILDWSTHEMFTAAKEGDDWRIRKLELDLNDRLSIQSFTVTSSDTLVLFDGTDKSEALQIYKIK